jgi:hypothetical protein
MDAERGAPLATETVRFAGGRHAVVLHVPREIDEDDVVAALGIGSAPVLVVCGGAESLAGGALVRVESFVAPAIVDAARRTRAIVLDGGTDSGVMGLVGAARGRDPDAIAVLVGVAPRDLVEVRSDGPRLHAEDADSSAREGLEPHHTHVVLVDADRWGEETPLLFSLARRLSDGHRIAVLLAGGGEVAQAEAAMAARHGWPLFAVAGTGGTADRLAATSAAGERGDGAGLRAIVADGDVRPVTGSESQDLARRLTWALDDDLVLQDAWQLFATCDRAAGRARRAFARFQTAIILLGILATLLALLHQEVGTQVLRWAVVAAPLVIGALVAIATRRAAGKRWVVLRAAAESVKSEIFRYRTRTGGYGDGQPDDVKIQDRSELLSTRLGEIQRRLMYSEVSGSELAPYRGTLPPPVGGEAADDDGLHALGAREYLRLRVSDQIAYYQRRVRDLERRRTALQVLAVVASAGGALVAAAGAEIWVALTTAIAAAPPAYLAYLQVDSTIIAYNQAAARLEILARDWHARDCAPHTHEAFDSLVCDVETVLTSELGGWMEQMVNAIRELQERQQRDHEAKL